MNNLYREFERQDKDVKLYVEKSAWYVCWPCACATAYEHQRGKCSPGRPERNGQGIAPGLSGEMLGWQTGIGVTCIYRRYDIAT
jgi:hypothetical protein